MLTLSRRAGESIILKTPSETLTIRIRELRRKEVRIGVEAPKYVEIHRDELYVEADDTAAYTRVECCPRCGGCHQDVNAVMLAQFPQTDDTDYFALCPATGHPIMLKKLTTRP